MTFLYMKDVSNIKMELVQFIYYGVEIKKVFGKIYGSRNVDLEIQ